MKNRKLDTNKVHEVKERDFTKIRNKNHQIRSFYEEEIPITKFISELKRKNESSFCSSSRGVATWRKRISKRLSKQITNQSSGKEASQYEGII
jgi:hypothetical protein